MNRLPVVGRQRPASALLSALLLYTLGAVSGLGCNPGEDINVCVYVAPMPYTNPFDAASRIKISAIGDDPGSGARTILKSREFSASRGAATLGLIPFGENVQIQVEVMDGNGNIIGYGGSNLHDLLALNDREGELPTLCAFITPSNTVVPAVLQASQQQAFTMVGRVGHTATVLEDGKVLITGGGRMAAGAGGGLDPTTIAGSVEVYDVESGRFLTVLDAMGGLSPMNEPRAFHTATLLPDGSVLLAGGLTQTVGMLSTTSSWERFRPESCIFPGIAAMTQVVTGCVFESGLINTMADPRSRAAATLRPDGSVFISGGQIEVAGMDTEYLNTTELWSEAAGFAPAGAIPLAEARSCHAQALLPHIDGTMTVVISGGWNANPVSGTLQILSTVERFTGTSLEPAGNMGTPRACHTLNTARLSDTLSWGFAVGGYTGTTGGAPSMPSPVVEVYDPNTASFNPAFARPLSAGVGGTMVGVADHTTTTLPDGRLVVLGGKTGANVTGVLVAILETAPNMGITPVLDPDVLLLRPRASHTASLLPSGQILLVGGFDSAMGGAHEPAEMFTAPLNR